MQFRIQSRSSFRPEWPTLTISCALGPMCYRNMVPHGPVESGRLITFLRKAKFHRLFLINISSSSIELIRSSLGRVDRVNSACLHSGPALHTALTERSLLHAIYLESTLDHYNVQVSSGFVAFCCAL